MGSKLVIRNLSRRDISAALELCKAMHQETVYAFLPFDEIKVQNTIQRYLSDPAKYFAGVALYDEHKVVGVLAGYLTTYPFCDEKLASDQMFFVVPDSRGGRAAVGLQKAFKAWAKQVGAREIRIGVSSGVSIERANSFLRRLGMTDVGSNFKERLD
jgi:GNAT superfamily N-acetyltransferase